MRQHTLEQLVIAFDNEVDGTHLDNDSIRVFVRNADDFRDPATGRPVGRVNCWCEVPLKPIQGIQYKDPCHLKTLVPGGQSINAVRFRMAWMPPAGTVCRVVVNGDWILDRNGKAVDADHIRPWLSGNRKTGDGVEGGTFESWFTLVD